MPPGMAKIAGRRRLAGTCALYERRSIITYSRRQQKHSEANRNQAENPRRRYPALEKHRALKW